jgi:uncharacterized protein YhaN
MGVSDLQKLKNSIWCIQTEDVVSNLAKQLEEILEGEDFNELESSASYIALPESPRSSSSIGKDLGAVDTKIGQCKIDIELKTKKIKEWEAKYKNQDSLLDLLLDKKFELKNLNKTLQNLKPLPKSAKTPDEFIQTFETKQAILTEKQAELSEFKMQQASLIAQAPEETQEEMQENIRIAESHYEHLESDAVGILDIRYAFIKIKGEKDSQTLDPWLDELGRVLAPLTAERYTKVKLLEDSLSRAVRTDGLEIPFDLLSAGTKVGLGLAVLLSMARYFLEGLDGFLIMDDPLVDMDPKRQEATAKVIQNFSRAKQVLIATCHPEHANLLGGNTIIL